MIITNLKKLRKVSKRVSLDEDVSGLITQLYMATVANKGAGLAAIQLGHKKRIIITMVRGELKAIINPEILDESGRSLAPEGCLSLPGVSRMVERPAKVTYAGWNSDGTSCGGTLEDCEASGFCHEVDHLDGILIIDKPFAEIRLSDLTLTGEEPDFDDVKKIVPTRARGLDGA